MKDLSGLAKAIKPTRLLAFVQILKLSPYRLFVTISAICHGFQSLLDAGFV